MNKSESITNISISLCKFQSEIENPKNTANNPFFKSKYCPLPDILTLVRPILTKHGLSIIQSPSGDGSNIVIHTMLLHESGEWIEFEPLILRADKATAQGAGSAITYARRYAISAVLGISSEDDDDGNYATDNDKKHKQENNNSYEETKKIRVINEAQLKRLQTIASGHSEIAKEVLKNMGYESSKDITVADYNSVVNEIQDRLSKIKGDK